MICRLHVVRVLFECVISFVTVLQVECEDQTEASKAFDEVSWQWEGLGWRLFTTWILPPCWDRLISIMVVNWVL